MTRKNITLNTYNKKKNRKMEDKNIQYYSQRALILNLKLDLKKAIIRGCLAKILNLGISMKIKMYQLPHHMRQVSCYKKEVIQRFRALLKVI